MYCSHNILIELCKDPVCAAMQRARVARAAEENGHEVIETEHELPEWIDELRLDGEGVIVLRAKAIVHVPGVSRGHVATFDYQMTAEHVDGVIDALSRLRDRARQLASVIDVPSSTPPRSPSG